MKKTIIKIYAFVLIVLITIPSIGRNIEDTGSNNSLSRENPLNPSDRIKNSTLRRQRASNGITVNKASKKTYKKPEQKNKREIRKPQTPKSSRKQHNSYQSKNKPAVNNLKIQPKPESIRKQYSPRSSKNRPAAKNFKLNVRALAAGNAAKEKTGSAQLKPCEKELTSYLNYKDYKVLKSGSSVNKPNESYKIRYDKKTTLTITPLSEDQERVRVRVQWDTKGEPKLSKELYFKRGKRSIISGPRERDGGMYLMSLEIQ